MSIYSISMSNYSSNQNTQNPVDETLAAVSGSMDALPSNATSSEKGGHELAHQIQDCQTNRRLPVTLGNLA